MIKFNQVLSFNKMSTVGDELRYVQLATNSGKLSGDGPFNKKCVEVLKNIYKSPFVGLTPSCTAALEMAYLLIDLRPGDEVILPSFTFTSTATAVTLFGATPVFVDVDESFNIDIKKAVAAITPKTKAICVVHYAGQSCDLDLLKKLISDQNIYLIEDAAQAIGAQYNKKPLGISGDISCFSFHETKNIGCGEGGAILVNNKALVARAEILKDKGTNRQQFFRGEVDKYSWQDKGSSYLLGELSAAYLLAQLENIDLITKKRQSLFDRYFSNLNDQKYAKYLKLPKLNGFNEHNGHIFYAILNSENSKVRMIEKLKTQNIMAASHYVPLHSSKAGLKWGKISGDLQLTETYANRLLRLPLFYDLSLEQVDQICEQIIQNFIDIEPI